MQNLIRITTLIATIVSLAIPGDAVTAADIRVSAQGPLQGIVIEGPIEAGDSITFIKLVKDNQAELNNVYIYSPGGDFEEAMKIGRAMRSLEMNPPFLLIN